jgi:peroxiredoxin
MGRISGLTALACAASLTVAAQELPRPIGVDALGPQVGERVPDFTLQDSTGSLRSLDSLMGASGALIVFSRSADWCPYCKTQMIEIQGRLPELQASGLGVAAITYDPPAALADFARRQQIAFPLLSDPGSKVIRAYGILNTTVDPTSTNYGIPFPGTFLVDRQGVVIARYFEEAYQERTTVSNILLQLGSTPGSAATAATRIATDHLQATAYASDAAVAPGTLFSLVVDVEPKPGMHVYAPGAGSYRPIALELDANPLLVTRPPRYPESEIYFFEPLDERVPVFQRPFRLAMDLAISASREARAALEGTSQLTIHGTLTYQACDDTVCYLPQAIPVSFTVGLRPLDTQRASPR